MRKKHYNTNPKGYKVHTDEKEYIKWLEEEYAVKRKPITKPRKYNSKTKYKIKIEYKTIILTFD